MLKKGNILGTISLFPAPITDALLDDEHDLLFLAVACKIAVLNCSTLTTLASQYVASAASGSQVPMFEKFVWSYHVLEFW